jgi:hypothetical protein
MAKNNRLMKAAQQQATAAAGNSVNITLREASLLGG